MALPSLVRSLRLEEQFYRALLPTLPPGLLIFDIGANHGAKSAVFLRLGARVVAVEPDLTNQRILRQKFHYLRLRRPPIEVVPRAAGAERGRATFWIDGPGSAKNTLSEKWVGELRFDPGRFGRALTFAQHREVEVTTLDDLIRDYGSPAFVKIDVEGFEDKVIAGLSRPVHLLSFEVNLPTFVEEGLACVRMLEALRPAGLFNLTSDCARGLALPCWLGADQIGDAIRSCQEPSIEVFWRSGVDA